MTRRRFTLLEVLVAAAILGLTVALVVSLLASARENLLRSERAWARQHLLSQGVHYFLLSGPQASPPEWLLTEGYRVVCDVRRDQDDLPLNAREPMDGWVLAIYRVRLLDRAGQELSQMEVRKMARQEDVP